MIRHFFACMLPCILAQSIYAMADQLYTNKSLSITADVDPIDAIMQELTPNSNQEIDLHATNDFGETPLLVSAREGDALKAFIYSIVAPNRVNKQDIFGKTALMQAAARNYHELTRILLERKAQPNIQDSNGNTALHLATMAGHHESIKHLIACKADLNIQNNVGDTAILIAARNFQFKNMLLLRSSGADLYLSNHEGETLDACLKEQFFSEEEYKSIVFGATDVVYTTKEYPSELKESAHDQPDQRHSRPS